MMRILLLILFSFGRLWTIQAQIISGSDTLYGNEWIKYNQTYYKLYTAQDGLYKITYEDLNRAGIPIQTIKGSQLQLWNLGQEVPLYMANSGTWNTGEAFYFVGAKNRSELDSLLFAKAYLEMLNPEYSLVTDSATFFLTWVPEGSPTKRVNAIGSNDQLPSSPFYWADQSYEYHQNPLDKRYDPFNEIALSTFDAAEGFGSRLAKEFKLDLKPTDVYQGNNPGTISIRLAGNNSIHKFQVSINGVVVKEDNFIGFQVRQYEIPVSNDQLRNEINLKIEGMQSGSDAFTVANIHFIYPKIKGAALSAHETLVPAEMSTMVALDKLSSQSLLIAPQSLTWYTSTLLNGQYHLELKPDKEFKKNHIASIPAAMPIGGIHALTLEPIYKDLGNNYLIITHSTLKNASETYAAYRRSAAGGGFKVGVLYIDQIYDQFGYGVARHIIGLKNFAMYIHRNWVAPQFIFMIGRAVNYRDLRVDDNLRQAGHLHLIPTYGYPGSDNLIFAPPRRNLPVFNMARLAASTPDQVITYLNKVKEYEDQLVRPKTNDDLYWRKRVLHLAGGGPTDGFDVILDDLKKIIESNDLRSDVASVKKSSSDPVQGGVSEIVKNIINNGVFMHTYLGHGAVTATEIGLDDPEIFNNVGKYPICFTLGCNSGNIHTLNTSLSEVFLFSKKGDIAYISSSGIGTDIGYKNYSEVLYKHLGEEYYNSSIAELHFSALNKFELDQSFYSIALNQQHTLHGDPALKVNYYNDPDITLDIKSFQTIPENIQAEQKELRFKFTMWNLGRHYGEPIDYEVKHLLPDGRSFVYTFSEVLMEASKEVVVTLPMPENAIGNNRIFIRIDPNNEIKEGPIPFAENNNELKGTTDGVVVGIFNNEAKPIYPKNFGIVGEPGIELKAFTTNAFNRPSAYNFEIDTTILFNSNQLRTGKVVQRGGLITWNPNLSWQANRVYYWRVAADTVGTSIPLFWNQASFIYLPGQGPGWNQSHSYQYASNPPNQSLSYDLKSNGWTLANEPVSVVATSINQEAEPNGYSTVRINGDRFTRDNRVFQSEIILTIWDPKLGLIRNPVGGRDGAQNVFGSPAPGYYFPMDKNTTEERSNLIRFMEQGVKDGQYVIVITHIESGKTFFPDFWANDVTTLGKTLFDVFEANGAKQIRELAKADTYSHPYVLVYKKGQGLIEEVVSRNGISASANFELPLQRNVGVHQSALIGPATSWEKFEWKHADSRDPKNNTIVVYGQADPLQLDTLYKGMASSFDLRTIDAGRYPYLKLEWTARDSLKRGAIDMSYWRIFYKSYADLAISANDDFEFYKDTIDQGEDVRLRFTLQNLGDQSIDSSVIIYTISDHQNKVIIDTAYVSLLRPGGKKSIQKLISTTSRINNQSILVNVQPRTAIQEFSLLNNVGKLNFFVQTDIIPPVIHVLFDGKQIINNEIVARRPLIHIDLKDNKILSRQDSAQVEISLKSPGSDKYVIVAAKEYTISYSKSEASIQYLRSFTTNGQYAIRIQGKDRSGNAAGIQPYEISFRIFTENSVSSILPYPNPFSTQCRFAYTMTGERPMVFKIQIMTVSGRVVRELTELDLGPLEEGTHLTERSWDGTDEYGNKLATGTYLYRVVMKDINGKTYSSFEDLAEAEQTDTRKFFTKGLGKLVILR